MRAGKSFDIRLATDDPAEAERLLRRMCEKLLANTVVEEYAVEITPAAAPPAPFGDAHP